MTGHVTQGMAGKFPSLQNDEADGLMQTPLPGLVFSESRWLGTDAALGLAREGARKATDQPLEREREREKGS